MTTAEKNQTDDIILTVESSGDSSRREDEIEKETFVFRARGQSEEEPLRLESPTKHSHNGDDHTEETCEVTSRESSQGESHDEEMGPHTTEVPSSATAGREQWMHDLIWLAICFFGIMASFVAYGIMLEYATSEGRHLHELSFLFVTSVLGTITAYTGRTIKKETIADIPANRFVLLGLMSLGSTFCAIRSLRYVIFPIQVLARSCKPVPVLLIGTLLGKKYPRRKFISVFFIVCGVAMFMGGGNILKGGSSDDSSSTDGSLDGGNSTSMDAYTAPSSDGDDEQDESIAIHKQIFGVALLITSLFFDGGTGAYEDKLMSVHSLEPFDLMFKFQLSKALLSAFILIVFNQTHLFVEMIQQTGIYIIALGMCSAIGQVFIFITIAKFGALTTSLMSLTRKVTTLTASIIIYNHDLSGVQLAGLLIALAAMIMNFVRPKAKPETAAASENSEPEKLVKGDYASVPTADDEHHSAELARKGNPV